MFLSTDIFIKQRIEQFTRDLFYRKYKDYVYERC